MQTLKREMLRFKKQGKTIAFTNGCFDILHAGHVSYLREAKKNNRVLIVGLNSDRSIKKIKDSRRPIMAEDERALILSALECVDFVVLFHEATPLKLIQALSPDVLIKGADWKGKEVAGSFFVQSYAGKIEYVRYLAKFSSTKVIETIIKKYCS